MTTWDPTKLSDDSLLILDGRARETAEHCVESVLLYPNSDGILQCAKDAALLHRVIAGEVTRRICAMCDSLSIALARGDIDDGT